MSLVLITGGAGFIGSNLTKVLLNNGYKVRILDNLSPQIHADVPQGLEWLIDERIDFIRGSVSDKSIVEKALDSVDIVVHLAAETGTGQSMYEVEKYYAINVQGTALLFDILTNSKHHVKKIILASSRSIYGEGAFVCPSCADNIRYYPDARKASQLAKHEWEYQCSKCGGTLEPVPTLESDPNKSASLYAATKYAQEDLVRISSASLGIEYSILRLQNVYGEGQSLNNPYTGILSIFSTKIRKGSELPIFEDGLETRDFVHVEDVANAFYAAIASKEPVNDIINVGSGVKTTVKEVAEQLSVAFGTDPNIVITSQYRLGDIRHNYADIHKLKEKLGYEPKIDLAEGLRRFANWVNTQPLPEDKLDKANAELKARNMMG